MEKQHDDGTYDNPRADAAYARRWLLRWVIDAGYPEMIVIDGIEAGYETEAAIRIYAEMTDAEVCEMAQEIADGMGLRISDPSV